MSEETVKRALDILEELKSLRSARTVCESILFKASINLGNGRTGYHYSWVQEIHKRVEDEAQAIIDKHIKALETELAEL